MTDRIQIAKEIFLKTGQVTGNVQADAQLALLYADEFIKQQAELSEYLKDTTK